MVKKKVSRKKKGINAGSAVLTHEEKMRSEDTEKKRKAKEITCFINSFKSVLFDMFKNPLVPWQVYLLCRENGVPAPEWALEYFDDCAKKLLDIENPGKTAPKLCYEALGFEKKEAGTPWTKFEDALKMWGAYCRFQELIEADSKKWGSKTRSLKKVSTEYNADKETLRKWFKKFEKSLL